MLIQEKQQFNEILTHLSQALDITEHQYETAEKRYKALGEYLQERNTSLAPYIPEVYPQGSFRLGTVIRPINREDEFDLDLVCKLCLPPDGISQYDLKKKIGDRITERQYYKQIMEPEGNRCWTLKYTEEPGFHMDILPAIPDRNTLMLEAVVEKDVLQKAIRITDKRHKYYHSSDAGQWPKSNPLGYSEWFKDRMKSRFAERRMMLAESLKMSVEDVPEWRVKTPLQRAIQIMKRHRDIRFGDDEDKPISIIITTLAAKAYNQEDNIYDALINLLSKMPDYIEHRNINGRVEAWVPNPVNPFENFADKWPDHPEKEENFNKWITKAKYDLIDSVKQKGISESYDLLKGSLGNRSVIEAYKLSGYERIINESAIQKPAKISSTLAVTHRQNPPWPVHTINNVEIYVVYKNGSNWLTATENTVLPKDCEIKFIANANVRKPFTVYWQVVNTGEEAANANDLRGTIFPAKTAGVGGLKHNEYTRYKGTHWIECFIVKDGVCIARSNEYFINIA